METQDIEKSLIQLINRQATLNNPDTPSKDTKSPKNLDDLIQGEASPVDSPTKVNEDL